MITVRDKAAPQIAAFHRTWVRMDDAIVALVEGRPRHHEVPALHAGREASYAAELDDFFAEVAFTNGSYKDLLLSNVGFVNKDNAGVYGLTSTDTNLTEDEPRCHAASGLPDPCRLPELVLALRLHGADPARRVHHQLHDWRRSGTAAAQHDAPAAAKRRHDQSREDGSSDESVGELHGLPQQRPQSARLRAGELRQPSASGRSPIRSAGRSTRRRRSTSATATASRSTMPLELMQELAKTPVGQLLYAQSLVSSGYGRDPNANDQCVVDQIGAKLAHRRLHDSQSPHRPDAGGFVPPARPRDALKARGGRTCAPAFK